MLLPEELSGIAVEPNPPKQRSCRGDLPLIQISINTGPFCEGNPALAAVNLGAVALCGQVTDMLVTLKSLDGLVTGLQELKNLCPAIAKHRALA